MKRMMIEYRVKAGCGDENEAAIRRVFDELRQQAPDGLRYAVFKGEDGLSFVHLVSIETEDGSNPLQALDTFKAFTETGRDRREGTPQRRALHQIGAYRWF